MSAETRARLAAQQADLVAALTGRGEGPAGFDSERLRVVASALTTKRLRAVGRAWPDLATELGDRFAEVFRRYAQTHPLPHLGGPLADGRAFARFLAANHELPDAGRSQALAVDLHYAGRADGLVRRRWPYVRFALFANPCRLIVASRLPWLGEGWLTLPLRHRRSL
jgi:hypothetical protein